MKWYEFVSGWRNSETKTKIAKQLQMHEEIMEQELQFVPSLFINNIHNH